LNVAAILKIVIARNISMSDEIRDYRKTSFGRHFQNGHHNAAQIQYFPISTTFHMWVDYDVLTLNNF
jgi:hypothetical protein